jgi:hypothetical protein
MRGMRSASDECPERIAKDDICREPPYPTLRATFSPRGEGEKADIPQFIAAELAFPSKTRISRPVRKPGLLAGG